MILTISRRPSATYENQALQVNKNYYFNVYWIDHWQLIHGKDSCSRASFSQDNQTKDRTLLLSVPITIYIMFLLIQNFSTREII